MIGTCSESHPPSNHQHGPADGPLCWRVACSPAHPTAWSWVGPRLGLVRPGPAGSGKQNWHHCDKELIPLGRLK